MHIGTQVRLFVHLEGFTQVSGSPFGSDLPRAMAHSKKILNIQKIQRLFPCGRRLQDVAASLQQVLNNLRNCPRLATLDIRSSDIRATI